MTGAPPGPRWLPLGLHVTLVLAAGALAFPAATSRAEDLSQWLMCLPLRALPAAPPGGGDDAEIIAALSAEGLRRQEARALHGATAGPGWVPRVCRVLQRRAPGAAGRATLLVLDRTWSEVAGFRPIATSGGVLVGWLGEPGDVAADDPASGFAVVRCVHHHDRSSPPRRLRAMVDLGADHPALRLVLEPASRIDPWPLRCALVEDPYLASGLAGGGQPVVSRGDATGWTGDLAVGTLRVWGYTAAAGTALPIGFYVEPAFDPQAIANVVLWCDAPARSEAARGPDDAVRRLPLRGFTLPGGSGRRFVVAASRPATALPAGAAVVTAGAVLVGVVDRPARGHGLVSEFGADARPWSLVLVPQDPDLPPREMVGIAVARDGAGVELRVETAAPPVAGLLLTGANGMHCPAGLVIGEARPLGAAMLLVVRPATDGALSACVRQVNR